VGVVGVVVFFPPPPPPPPLRGAEVVIVERGVCGRGASEGNGGWISPGLSEPLPEPGVTAQALRWTVNPRSPFLLRPVPRLAYAHWLYNFWRSTTPARHHAGTLALLSLSTRALADFDALAAAGVRFEMHRDGMLFLAFSERLLEHQAERLSAQRAHGYRGGVELLDAAQARALEPSLGERIAGAVFAPAERHVRPESLVEGLLTHLRAARADIWEHTAVRSLQRRSGGWLVNLERGVAERFERVVVAAGAWTSRLLAPLGVRLLLEGAKGYSLTYEGLAAPPRHALYMMEAKVGLSPFKSAMRLAGTLELGSDSTSPDGRRIDCLPRSARRYLRDWGSPTRPPVRWAGLRPLTPDGLPVIGAVPGHDGLHVATGHGTLGVTLSATTGEALAPVVLGERGDVDLTPFSISRPGICR
jgi:D-amino-acid dehydrogenase